MNESFNPFESDTYGKLSREKFIRLCKKILPDQLKYTNEKLEAIYDFFSEAKINEGVTLAKSK